MCGVLLGLSRRAVEVGDTGHGKDDFLAGAAASGNNPYKAGVDQIAPTLLDGVGGETRLFRYRSDRAGCSPLLMQVRLGQHGQPYVHGFVFLFLHQVEQCFDRHGDPAPREGCVDMVLAQWSPPASSGMPRAILTTSRLVVGMLIITNFRLAFLVVCSFARSVPACR